MHDLWKSRMGSIKMKPFLFILPGILLLLGIYIFVSGKFISSESLPEKDDALEQWAASLEPICEFKVTKGYPNVILEMFNQLIEQKNTMTEDQHILHAGLKSVTVYGTQEEFCVVYAFSGELEYLTDSGSSELEPFDEMTMQVRMRKKNETTYELIAQGGGPIAYGLEQTDLTLESIE